MSSCNCEELLAALKMAIEELNQYSSELCMEQRRRKAVAVGEAAIARAESCSAT